MMMPSSMILTICISMVLKRNRGLSLDIGSRYDRAKHKTHISNHKSVSWISSARYVRLAGSELGGRSRPPVQIFSHQCRGHLQSVGALTPNPLTNRTLY